MGGSSYFTVQDLGFQGSSMQSMGQFWSARFRRLGSWVYHLYGESLKAVTQ